MCYHSLIIIVDNARYIETGAVLYFDASSLGSWFTSSTRRRGRDRQSTRVNGQESGSLIAAQSRRISLYWFFRLPPPLTIFFLSRTAARASSTRVWESLAHVSTSVRTNDRAAAVATDSLHRTATYSVPRPSVRRPFTHSSGERARETPGAPLRPTITSVTSRPADDRLAPEPPPDPTNAVNDYDDDRPPTTGPDHALWPGGVRFALPRRGVARAVRAIRYAPSVGLRAVRRRQLGLRSIRSAVTRVKTARACYIIIVIF